MYLLTYFRFVNNMTQLTIDLVSIGVPNVDYFSDFRIVCNEKIFYVHRSLLSLKSEKFKTIFNSTVDNILNVNENPDSFEKFLLLFYLDNYDCKLTVEQLADVDRFVNEYLCDKKILDKINWLFEFGRILNWENYTNYIDYPNEKIRTKARGFIEAKSNLDKLATMDWTKYYANMEAQQFHNYMKQFDEIK